MRLWHYELIPTLSRQHLLGQWREVLAITGAIRKQGEVNHATVNRLKDYDLDHLLVYIQLVKEEMNRRGYRTTVKSQQKLIDDVGYNWARPLPYHKDDQGLVTLANGQALYAGFHDDRYLLQNLYMMQEKADTDQIDWSTWQAMVASMLAVHPTLPIRA
ncbi:pyrimidine dimer DNA glycosylase/endonuclease V [Leuconostocaceae bacterium ESL0958]|nr:pyrimidine dimer DNA glycosylase/endonuclease V [Leuconostocaceae bacterium ESL0958]